MDFDLKVYQKLEDLIINKIAQPDFDITWLHLNFKEKPQLLFHNQVNENTLLSSLSPKQCTMLPIIVCIKQCIGTYMFIFELSILQKSG